MTASANPSSSTTQPASLPKSPDVARRHYVTQALRYRSDLAKARADGADEEQLADIAESFADAKEMARRACSWGRRATRRTAALPPPIWGVAARKSARLNRTAPITARDAEVLEGKGTFRDPYDATTFVTTTVNRRVDVLAAERAAGRITEAQLHVGRMMQAVWEKQLGVRAGSAWDSTTSNVGPGARVVTQGLTIEDIRMLGRIETARVVKVHNDRAARVIGDSGVRFLRAILAEGQTFGAYAEARGRGASERASSDIAKRFRWLLEELTEAQHTARAPAATLTLDEYSAQADAIDERLERSAALAAQQAAAEEDLEDEACADWGREAVNAAD